MGKKVYIETLGCQMNVRDSEHILAELNRYKDYEQIDDIKEADLILINTCSVREKPVSKLFSELGQFNLIKKDGAKIGVCGCTASHLGEEIIKKAPFVDFVLGARNVSKIKDVVDKKGAVEIDISNDETNYEFAEFRSSKYRASVNISLGCDKQCTFCIVPNTRGSELSIPPDVILKEVKKAVDSGAKEVLLLGQNVNNYGKSLKSKINFTDLLKMVSDIDGLKRIRFTSPHPLHMDDEFIDEFANNEKICKSIHVPLQSGSTKILKQMKRGYTKEWFLNRCEKIKSLVDDVRITTDIIVGFPGEEDSDFEDTIDVVERVKFDQIFNFIYSPRPLTPAANYDNQVDKEVASKRLQRLIELHKTHQKELMDKNIGKILEVYFEELKEDNQIFGYSDNFIQVFVKGSEELLGEIKKVKIVQAYRTKLIGEAVE